MVVTVRSLGLTGITGYEVSVECVISGGLPAFDVVGLPDAAVKEARERVRAAVKNCGEKFPVSRITVNLAPARVRKEGTVYDLPILLGILAAAEEICPLPEDAAFLGELSLTGALRPVTGVLRQGLQLLRRRKDTQQDGQVVQRTLLADTGGGQIHGDAADGELGAAVFHGGADTLPRFLDGGVRQTHHVKGGQPAGEEALHRHLVAADAGEPQRTHSDHHGQPSPFQFVVQPSSYHKTQAVNSGFFKKPERILRGTTLSGGPRVRIFVHGAKKVS